MRKYRHYIKEKMKTDYKKAAIFVYWLNDYIEYIRNEKNFVPGQLINYKRGQIVLVNFGYRIGSELGGNHYAIVLDVKNSRHNNTLTVVPLKSKKDKESPYSKVYHVPLGECVTELLYDKAFKIINSCNEETKEIVREVVVADLDKEREAKLRARLKILKRDLRMAKNVVLFIDRLNKESVADIGQVVTVSKQRISMPCKKQDTLTDVIVPKEIMKIIDDKLNFLYCDIDAE